MENARLINDIISERIAWTIEIVSGRIPFLPRYVVFYSVQINKEAKREWQMRGFHSNLRVRFPRDYFRRIAVRTAPMRETQHARIQTTISDCHRSWDAPDALIFLKE